MRELLAKLPTPDDVLRCTAVQLDAILFAAIAEVIARGRKDQTAVRYVSTVQIQKLYAVGNGTFGRRDQADNALNESWHRLLTDGFIIQAIGQSSGMMTLSSKGDEAATAATDFEEIRERQMLRREMLHPDLHGAVYDAFAAGHYDTAVLEAFKLVEVAVRTAAGLSANVIGVNLMRQAFDPKSGPLSDPNMPTGERDRMPELFAGAIGVFKNPLSHRRVGKSDPIPVTEELMFASRLLRFVKP